MDIYKLTSPSGKVYIGKAKNAERRWSEHKQTAKRKRYKTHLYAAIEKYGWDNFRKEIIDTAESIEDLNQKEIYWIAFYRSYEDPTKGYNETPGGDGGDTWNSLSEERKREAIAKRPPVSEETKKKLSKIMKSRFANMPHHNKGLRWHRKTPSTPWNKGLTGIPGHALSEEAKKRIGDKLRNKPKSEEHKQKLREVNLGKHLSDETRAKMSASKKGIEVETLQCPYCGKVGKSHAMYRWHFENCREKPNESNSNKI